MCSGYFQRPRARLLVKGEWDKAEEWLEIYIDGEQ
jgi:hypothetical protein